MEEEKELLNVMGWNRRYLVKHIIFSETFICIFYKHRNGNKSNRYILDDFGYNKANQLDSNPNFYFKTLLKKSILTAYLTVAIRLRYPAFRCFATKMVVFSYRQMLLWPKLCRSSSIVVSYEKVKIKRFVNN